MIKRERVIAFLIRNPKGRNCFCLLQSNISSLAQSVGATEVLTGAVFAVALTPSSNGHEGKDDCSADQMAKPERLSMDSQAKKQVLTGAVLGAVLAGDGHEGQDDGGVDQIAKALVAEDQHHSAPAEVPQALEAVGPLTG